MIAPAAAEVREWRIDFAAGGTGGHLQPALALAEELERRSPFYRCRFLIAGRPVEQSFLGDREVIEVFPGQASRPSPLRLDQWAKAVRRLMRGGREGRPDLVVLVGGYVSAVAALARTGVPWLLLEPDRVPGKVTRVLRPLARRVLRQWPDGMDSHRVRTSGMPLRWSAFPPREEARRALGLDRDAPTLLVCGGSQGARAINRRIIGGLGILAQIPGVQVIHLCGRTDEGEVRAAYEMAQLRSIVAPFRGDMARLYAAADLVVARAGGMTVAEIAAAGRTAVFVPYPHHTNDHQAANARMLVDAGAAELVRESDCSEQEFVPRWVAPRLRDLDGLRLAEIRSLSLGRPDASLRVADEVERILRRRGDLA